MSIKIIGNFQIEVSKPYPVWCYLRYLNREFKFTHSELSDLKYAVDELIKEAANKLGDRKNEI